MQEQIIEKGFSVCLQTTQLTLDAILKLLNFLRGELNGQTQSQSQSQSQQQSNETGIINHGRMSVKELYSRAEAEGTGISVINIKDTEYRDFAPILKKYGVDHSFNYDKNSTPPIFNVMFKAKNAEIMEAALAECANATLAREGKVPLREVVANFKDKVADRVMPERAKAKVQEQAL